ncbi:hypothetical protein V491_07242, partial [Pseudogymnoascus sp. VKM F-3775]
MFSEAPEIRLLVVFPHMKKSLDSEEVQRRWTDDIVLPSIYRHVGGNARQHLPTSYRLLRLDSEVKKVELGLDIGDTPLCVSFRSDSLEGVWADIVSKTKENGFEEFSDTFLVALGQWHPTATINNSVEGAWTSLVDTWWDLEMDMNYIPTETFELDSRYGLDNVSNISYAPAIDLHCLDSRSADPAGNQHAACLLTATASGANMRRAAGYHVLLPGVQYSNIKRSIRYNPEDLLVTQGIATAALTLPESAAKGSARVRAIQQRLLRRMQGFATPDDPDASRPFAREPSTCAADTVSAQPADDPATDLPTDAVLSARSIALHASAALLPADGVPADLGVVRAGIRDGAGQDAPSIPGAGVSGVGGGTVEGRGGSRSVG